MLQNTPVPSLGLECLWLMYDTLSPHPLFSSQETKPKAQPIKKPKVEHPARAGGSVSSSITNPSIFLCTAEAVSAKDMRGKARALSCPGKVKFNSLFRNYCLRPFNGTREFLQFSLLQGRVLCNSFPSLHSCLVLCIRLRAPHLAWLPQTGLLIPRLLVYPNGLPM